MMGIGKSVFEYEDGQKCTTPQIRRILPKMLDPRSPTEGIVRTPIEVTCTPDAKDLKVKASSISFDTPKTARCDENTCGGEIVKKFNVDCVKQGTEILTDEITSDSCELSDLCSIVERELKCDDKNCSDYGTSTEVEGHLGLVNIVEEIIDQVDTKKHHKSPMSKNTFQYLETDIDAVDDSFMNRLYIENKRVKQLKYDIDTNKDKKIREVSQDDANSAHDETTSITTYIEDQLDNMSSVRIEGILTNDTPSFDDLSLIVSDNEDFSSIACNNICKPTVQDWLITIEDNCDGLLPFDMSLSDKKTNFKDHKDSTQNRCLTPNKKRNHPLNAERTPLSCLVQNKICEPIKDGSTSLKRKQWRGIQEERQRRGLSFGDENTPPLQAPLDKVSSAPGKLGVKRRNIVEWDQDNPSVVI